MLSVFFGFLVGTALGLTGGGGGVFAVPLLVYGQGLNARAAISVSLISVGTAALTGFLSRLRSGDVELRPGLLFAAAGMIGAPVGAAIAARLPEALLLALLAVLMLTIAVRMWRSRTSPTTAASDGECSPTIPTAACRRDDFGQLLLTTRCARLLLTTGLGAGVLSGLFGVGGGFLIVPALVEFSSMPIRRAVGTSLLVIFLVSLSGISIRLWQAEYPPVDAIVLFLPGCLAGLGLGQFAGRKLPQQTLQRIFAAAILAAAAFMLARNLYG